MARKVSVQLDLDASRYLREAQSVTVTTKAVDEEMQSLGHATDAAGRDMEQMAGHAAVAKRQVDDLGDQVSGTSRAMDGLTGTTNSANHEVARFGSRAEEAAAALALLDARIAATRLSAHALGLEFARSGDVGVGKKFDSERSLLGQLSRLRSEVVAFANDGTKIGSSLASGIGAGLDIGGPQIKAALIGTLVVAAVAVTPIIGAIIAGAVTGGVGTGALVAGLIAASKDNRVRAAAADVGNTLQEEFFTKGGKAFVQPAIDGLRILEEAVVDMHLYETFAKAAPYVETIAHGLADFGRNIMPGVNKALDRAGPLANAFAEGMGELGTHLGDFLDDLSNTPGAVEGVETAFAILGVTLDWLGNTIKFLGDAYDAELKKWVKIADAAALLAQLLGQTAAANGWRELSGALQDIQTNATPIGDAPTKAIQSFGDAAWYAAMKTGNLSGAWDLLHGKFASADETLLRAKEAVDELGKSFRENGTAVDGNSDAALRNRVKMEQTAAAAALAAQRYYELTGDAAGATKIMDDQRIAAENSAKATGDNAKAVHDLAVKLFELPPFVEVKVNVTQSVLTRYTSTGNAPQINANLRMEDYLLSGKRASGGPVGPGAWLVGDGGKPEILQMGAGQNGYVYPSVQSWQSASAPSGGWQAGSGSTGGGNRTITVIVQDTSGRTLKTQLIDDALGRGVPSTTIAAAYP